MLNKIKEYLKDLKFFWPIVLFVTLMFEVVGITRYFKGGENSGNVFDLWFWATMSFVIISLECLIIAKKIRKDVK